MHNPSLEKNFSSSIILKRGREHSLKKKHHWIFSGAIERIEGEPKEGELVLVTDHKKRELAYGFFGTQSIAVRIVSFDPKIRPDTQVFFLLKEARKKRKKLGLTTSETTNSYRLFHSEGDLLPGLTIDKLNNIIVIQTHHAGITQFLTQIKDYLIQKFPQTKSIILKTGVSKESKDNFSFIFGTEFDCVITENNISFNVNVLEGQKTGFFLDQRSNREILGALANQKTILNLYCYTGGFSMYALKNNAKRVVSVDSSHVAIENAKENQKLLNIENLNSEFIEIDCLNYLRTNDEKFDVVVCDPPALVKSNRDLHKGLKHYLELQKLALSKVSPGGTFISFSCSQFVTDKDLLKVISKAAEDLKLTLSDIQMLKQAPCHPINPDHLESWYLKGYIVKVNYRVD